jgi:hypothetical protein
VLDWLCLLHVVPLYAGFGQSGRQQWKVRGSQAYPFQIPPQLVCSFVNELDGAEIFVFYRVYFGIEGYVVGYAVAVFRDDVGYDFVFDCVAKPLCNSTTTDGAPAVRGNFVST